MVDRECHHRPPRQLNGRVSLLMGFDFGVHSVIEDEALPKPFDVQFLEKDLRILLCVDVLKFTIIAVLPTLDGTHQQLAVVGLQIRKKKWLMALQTKSGLLGLGFSDVVSETSSSHRKPWLIDFWLHSIFIVVRNVRVGSPKDCTKYLWYTVFCNERIRDARFQNSNGCWLQ